MQTNVIGREAQRAATFGEWMAAKSGQLRKWYNSRSEFYTRIAGFEVTWKTAARVNLFTLLVVVAAIVAMQQPVVSFTSAACAAWVVYRLKSDEGKKGGDE